MASAVQEVKKILSKIPKNSSYEDIQYHIYVRSKIERGLKDIKENRVLSTSELRKQMKKWKGA